MATAKTKPQLNLPRPEKTLWLEDSELEFTMTYLMMNDILRFVGSPDEAMRSILMDQDTRDLVVRRMLTDAEKPIEDHADLISVSEVTIDIFEIDELLAWVLEHVTYFFMRTASKVQRAVGNFPELAKEMKEFSSPSKTGSKPSPQATKSAGPTK